MAEQTKEKNLYIFTEERPKEDNPITVIGGSKTKKINKKNKRSKVRSQKKRKGKK